MKVVVRKVFGWGAGKWYCALEAESGLIRPYESADFQVHEGQVFDLPDEQWQLDSKWYVAMCDDCQVVYRRLTCVGGELECPVCGHIDVVDSNAVGFDDEEDAGRFMDGF